MLKSCNILFLFIYTIKLMSMCLGISIVQYKQLNVTEQFFHNLKWTTLLFRSLDNLGHVFSVSATSTDITDNFQN